MTIYRALTNLETGKGLIKRGSVVINQIPPQVIELLVRRGGLAAIAAPPLAVVPGWTVRSKKLGAVGIVTVDQFLSASLSEVSAAIHVKPSLLQAWQAELINWLTIVEDES